jgi:hypothetical protein
MPIKPSAISCRRASLTAILFLSLLFPHRPAPAFVQEPEGFRGIPWGTSIRQLPDMVFIAQEGHLKFYEKPHDKMKIGEAGVDSIVYGFYKDRLYSVLIYFSSTMNFSRLKETLEQEYGEYQQPNPYVDKYLWYGKRLDLLFTYESVTQKGRIAYLYKPIVEEMEQDEKVKAKAGASDL